MAGVPNDRNQPSPIRGTMASSRLFQFRYSYERDLVDIMLKMSIGAAGAPTLLNSKGVTGVVRNSAGNYTISLKDNFNVLLAAEHSQVSSSAPAAPTMTVVTDSSNSQTAPLVIVQFSIGGVATDPANGEVQMIHLILRNAST